MATKAKPKDLRLKAPTSSLSGLYRPPANGTGGLAGFGSVTPGAGPGPRVPEWALPGGALGPAKAPIDPYAAAVYKAVLADQAEKANSSAPEGSYDPQLDAQGQNQNLSSFWQTQDYDTANQRALDDYNTAVGQLGTTHGYTLADLQKASNRDLEDYTTRTQDLSTQYGRLGTSQTQTANAAGVGHGGALVAAAAARAGNQATDQSKIQQGYDRQVQDIGTATDRENTGYQTSLSGLKLGYDRGGEDRTSTEQRQLGSNALFNTQLEKQKTYQAAQGGWLPTPAAAGAPATKPSAPTYRTVTHNGVVYHVYPDGTEHAVRKVGK